MNTDTSLRRRRDRSPYGAEDLARLRVLLLALRRELSESFEDLSDASDLSMAFAFLARAEAEMIEIDDAVERIDNRSYGLCETCDRPIPLDRLLAIPAARLCVSCKQADER